MQICREKRHSTRFVYSFIKSEEILALSSAVCQETKTLKLSTVLLSLKIRSK